MRITTSTIVLALALAGAACTSMASRDALMSRGVAADSGVPASVPVTIDPPSLPSDLMEPLKNPADAHAELCANDGAHPNFPNDADLVTKTFCQDLVAGGVMPTPHGLGDLLKQLGLDFKDPNGGNGVGGNPAFAILGHSSALTARRVSTITPTAFIFTPPPADGSKPPGAYLILAFDPGEQFVEIASYDPTGAIMNFYAVFFDQACTGAAGGCTTTDLLTPKLVTGWSNVRVYEDTTALGNTIMDCHVCHQPDNAADPFLRMQEMAPPFTHWFSAGTEGGSALLADFHAAHGDAEDYGGIPAALIDKSDPSKLAALVAQGGYGKQPNAFPSAMIESQLKASAPAQPQVNDPPGKSDAWQALYDAAAGGAFIATPYHDVKVTDGTKLKTMTAAYQTWLGQPASALPDIRDVFLDQGLRDMGFAPKLGQGGRGLLVQMCQECHHASLDPTLSRENFLVDNLDSMSRQEKDLAIVRIETGLDSRLTMPPPLFRTLTYDERQAMVMELQQ